MVFHCSPPNKDNYKQAIQYLKAATPGPKRDNALGKLYAQAEANPNEAVPFAVAHKDTMPGLALDILIKQVLIQVQVHTMGSSHMVQVPNPKYGSLTLDNKNRLFQALSDAIETGTETDKPLKQAFDMLHQDRDIGKKPLDAIRYV